VGEKGEQLGVMPVMQARELARKANLDIVEVAPTSVPPVCRLLDYGKFKYEQRKKEQQAKKNQKVTILREIRLRPKIGKHDFDFKARTAKKLLDDGAKVKVTLLFRGREITHPELGWKILQRMTEELAEAGTLERQPMMEGRRMDIIIAPIAQKPKAKTETKEATKTESKTEVKAETKVETKKETKAEEKEKVAAKTGAKETTNAKT
jgi:translation initiation factor IF-3